MPGPFSSLRNTRGQFISSQAQNDLEAAFYSVLHTKSQSALNLFQNLWQQTGLRGQPFEYVFGAGASRIPMIQPAGRPGSFPPPAISPQFPSVSRILGFQQQSKTASTSDPWYKVLSDIDAQEHEIKRILSQQLTLYKATTFKGGPGSFNAPVAPIFFGAAPPPPGGMKFAGGMRFAGAAAWPGGAAAPPRAWTTPPPPPGGGGPGGPGGGGRGGGGSGGLGFFGIGPAWIKRILELFGIEQIVQTAVMPAVTAQEIVRRVMRDTGPYYNYARGVYALGGAGGYDPERLVSRLTPEIRSGYGVHAMAPWLRELQEPYGQALSDIQTFGIVPRSPEAAERLAQTLGLARLTPGFRGMAPNAAVGALSQAAVLGVSGQEQGSYLDKIGGVLENAVKEGVDRTRILDTIQSTLSNIEKSGAPSIEQDPVLRLINQLMMSSLPGGRSGTLALQTVAGESQWASKLGADQTSTFLMALMMRQNQTQTPQGLLNLLGVKSVSDLSPEEQKIFQDVLQAEKVGGFGVYPQQILGELFKGRGELLRQRMAEAAKRAGLPGPMSRLLARNIGGIPYGVSAAAPPGQVGPLPPTSISSIPYQQSVSNIPSTVQGKSGQAVAAALKGLGTPDNLIPLFIKAGLETGVDPIVLASISKEESGFRSVGAGNQAMSATWGREGTGLEQLTKTTADWAMGRSVSLAEASDPYTNILIAGNIIKKRQGLSDWSTTLPGIESDVSRAYKLAGTGLGPVSQSDIADLDEAQRMRGRSPFSRGTLLPSGIPMVPGGEAPAIAASIDLQAAQQKVDVFAAHLDTAVTALGKFSDSLQRIGKDVINRQGDYMAPPYFDPRAMQ